MTQVYSQQPSLTTQQVTDRVKSGKIDGGSGSSKVSNVVSQINDVSATLAELVAELQGIEGEEADAQQEVNQDAQDVNSLQNQISALGDPNSKDYDKAQAAQLQQQLTEKEANLARDEQTLAGLQGEAAAIESQIETQKGNLDRLRNVDLPKAEADDNYATMQEAQQAQQEADNEEAQADAAEQDQSWLTDQLKNGGQISRTQLVNQFQANVTSNLSRIQSSLDIGYDASDPTAPIIKPAQSPGDGNFDSYETAEDPSQLANNAAQVVQAYLNHYVAQNGLQPAVAQSGATPAELSGAFTLIQQIYNQAYQQAQQSGDSDDDSAKVAKQAADDAMSKYVNTYNSALQSAVNSGASGTAAIEQATRAAIDAATH